MKNEFKIPIIKNNNYTMTIDDIGTNGEGIGKIDGYTLFVEGSLPGDEIEVKVVKIKKNYGFGILIKIIKPSKNRCQPICKVADKCGGCQLQHLEYNAQLEYKKNKVENALKRIGGIEDVLVHDTIGMDHPYYYRNKVQFPVGEKDGQVIVGFYAGRSHTIISTDTCYIQEPINDKIITQVKDYMVRNHIQPYNEIKHKGLIRHIVTRVSRETKEINVTIVINGNKLPNQDDLINRLSTIKELSSICININKEKTNVILGRKMICLWGEPYISDSIGDISFDISPLSFYQVNPIQTEKLYHKALEYANLSGEETVWDAYCGIGTISLFLARQAKKVYGVEIVPEAIEDAKKNARKNNIDNVEFFVGKAEEIITKKYEEENLITDVFVVDPPRKGCDQKLLDTIIQIQPKKMVYVSCDPSTMARDVKILVENGYQVEEVQPVDMFPHTTHVETVVQIIRKDNVSRI